jgi:hypothetical protein
VASKSTRDHGEIRRWADAHHAVPTVVGRTGGMLRFEFDPQSRESLTPVSWDDFFKVFDEKGLELLYDDKPGSRFHKIVYPETLKAKEEHKPAHAPARASKRLHIAGKAESGEASRAEGSKTAAGKSATKKSAASSHPEAEEEEEERPQKAGSRSPRTVATRNRRIAGGKVAYGETFSYGEEEES